MHKRLLGLVSFEAFVNCVVKSVRRVGTRSADGARVRAYALACCLLAATACDEKSPTGPTVPLDRRFTMSPGGLVNVEDAGFRLQFVGVTGDSRCPADAICVWAGDASVHLRVLEGSGRADYQLHTVEVPRAAVTHRAVRIALAELQPYPFSTRTIAPGDYRATLMVTRP